LTPHPFLKTRSDAAGLITHSLWWVLLIAAALSAAVPVDVYAQALFSATCLMLLWILRNHAEEDPEDFIRALVLVVGLFVSVRYIVWRAVYTLGASDWVSTVCAVLLLLWRGG
jgi:cellulose synthase (UDP-forming)